MKINYTRPFIYNYQRAILDSTARYTVCEASTKVGKTASHIIWLFEQPLVLDLKPGQKVWWVAPVYGQAEVAFHRMKNQVSSREFFKVNESKLRLVYPTGAEIHFKSAEKPDNLYGDDVYAAVFDEFTRSREESWFALRSTLTATKGKCKFIGNAKGKKNWGYKLGQKAKSGEKDFEYFKITAYDAAAEGLLEYEEIESAKRELPESVFRELYLAEASEDGSNPFGIEHINACSVDYLAKGPAVCYGIDLAKSVDWTVIIGLNANREVCYFKRFQYDWSTTKNEILQLEKNTPIYIDSTGVGDPIVEELQPKFNCMVGYKYSSDSKQKLMRNLQMSIQKRIIKFQSGVISDELMNFEFEHSRTGVKYSAPSGFHDDCVNALGLADECFNNYSTYGQYYYT